MGTWTEATSDIFRVRFDDDSRDEVEELVHTLEALAERLDANGLPLPPEPTLVIHPTPWSLALAQPVFAAAVARTEPLGRRYVGCWASGSILHLIAPRRLLRGVAKQPQLRSAVERVPASGLAHLAIGHANPALQLQRAMVGRRWFWLAWGAGQALVGQVPSLASSIAARRRERRHLTIAPAMRDAPVLGGSVVELVRRERGVGELVRLLRAPLPDAPSDWLARALPGIGSTERDVRWRMLLDDLDRVRAETLAEETARAAARAEAERTEREQLDRALEAGRRAQAEQSRRDDDPRR